MCGICGILYFDKNRQVDRDLLKSMNNLMSHRGPDDEGYYINGNIGLGHRRLSIIDLATGHQPMTNEDGTIWVTFNGEIYNYQELGQILKAKGHLIKTTSDTEVIIHAYEEYGEEVCEHLRGIFAFAIWDNRKKQLLLSRDRIGVKPLYFFKNDRCLLFASEMKSLLISKEIKREVNIETINYFFTLRYVPGPETMLRNVYKLNPGHLLTCRNGDVSVTKYWDLNGESIDYYDDEKYCEELVNILRTSVKLRLMSDVPLGVFLSGGVDSSAVVALMSELGVNAINTFTIGSKKKDEFNEFSYAKMVSRQFQTRHFEKDINYGDVEDLIKKMTWHFDEPVADPPALPLYMLSKFASNSVKVLLSGEGSDEVFGGYHIYYKMLLLDWIGRSKVANRAFSFLKRYGSQNGLLRQITLAELPIEKRYFGVGSFEMLSDDVKAMSSMGIAERFAAYYSKTTGCSSLKRMLYTDLKTWLPDELLLKADKMSMANSVELRVPFLDHKLVEYAFSLPDRLKIKAGRTKIILKKIMEEKLPRKILKRKKIGFTIPLGLWLKDDLHGFSQEILLNKRCKERGYYQQSYINRLIADHASGKSNNVYELWRLIILECWHRIFADGDNFKEEYGKFGTNKSDFGQSC